MGDSFDLELYRRLGQARNLHQSACGKIASEDLAPRAPNFFALRDVGDEDRDLHHIRHRAARSFDQVPNPGEAQLGLFVLKPRNVQTQANVSVHFEPSQETCWHIRRASVCLLT